MTAFGEILGQPAAISVLSRAIETGRLASSYAFEGPSGVGKQRTALALARQIVAGDDADAARRIDAGTHPDVRIFPPRDEGSRNLPVDVVRNEILPLAQFAPFEAKSAFLIFPEADVSLRDTHPEAANALLKTLEEPRKGVHFILLAERPDRLLATILSRCQRVRFARLPPRFVSEILAREGVAPEEREAAVALADGRADRALVLAQDGRAAALLDLALRVDDAIQSRRPGTLVNLAEEIAKHEDLRVVLEALLLFYRDLAAIGVGVGTERLAFAAHESVLAERARHVSPRVAAERAELLRAIDDDLDRNANPQLAMDALLHRLRRVA